MARKFQKYLRGAIEENTAFGALGGESVNKTDMDSVVNERTYVSSMKAVWGLSNFTPVASCGPIVVGIAHSDYTATEITEWINQSGSWNETNLVGQEIGRRKIRIVGTFDTPDAATDSVVLNDGKPISTKLGWILNQGQTLAVFVFNTGTASVATTTPTVHTDGHANLWPK